MEPIVSPWFVYFAGVVNQLKLALMFVSLIGLVCCFAAIVKYNSNQAYRGCSETYAQQCTAAQNVAIGYLKLSAIVTLVTCLLSVLIPDKDTMIAIAVANLVTVDNVNGANEFVKTNVQDYINMIVNAVNQVK